MSKAGLELVALNKAYGERRVVDTLSLTLPKGELLTLLGPDLVSEPIKEWEDLWDPGSRTNSPFHR
jgi:hypothetical protein